MANYQLARPPMLLHARQLAGRVSPAISRWSASLSTKGGRWRFCLMWSALVAPGMTATLRREVGRAHPASRLQTGFFLQWASIAV